MNRKNDSLLKEFFRFTIPSLTAQLVFLLYSMIDGVFIARGVSELALASVNLVLPFMALLFSAAICFSAGTSTVIAILFGEGEEEGANRVYSQNLATIVVVSALITAVVLLFRRPIALFLGAGPKTMEDTVTYLSTIACFALFFIVSYSLEVLIKTDGYPLKATIIVTIGCILNGILDFLFVIVWKKGVFGAAFATGMSQFFVVILYMTHFLSKRSKLKLVGFRFDRSLFFRIVRIGIASGITELSPGTVLYFFNHAILARMGEEYIASYTIVGYFTTITVMLMVGISQGVQPLISYYFGRREKEMYQTLFRYAMVAGAAGSVLMFGLSWLLAGPLSSLFISSKLPLLREETIRAFHIFSWSFLLSGFSIITGGNFTALERPRSAMVLSLLRGFVFPILTLEGMIFVFGKNGIWWSATVAEIFSLVFCIILIVIQKREKRA